MIIEDDLGYKLDGLTIKQVIMKLLEYPMGAIIEKQYEGDAYGHGNDYLIIKETDETN